jgi:hypothetical protein
MYCSYTKLKQIYAKYIYKNCKFDEMCGISSCQSNCTPIECPTDTTTATSYLVGVLGVVIIGLLAGTLIYKVYKERTSARGIRYSTVDT